MLDELITRLLHACYGASWASRLGGVVAITLLGRKCTSLSTWSFKNCQPLSGIGVCLQDASRPAAG